MALSERVESSLTEAEQSLRNALAFAARHEEPYVSHTISKMIMGIDQLKKMDKMFENMEDLFKHGEE
jgi:arsenate reductase-like glutaredoxin family protein|tara:strand:- start:248 stop:448 length:201 start_codon:yes stop_codon:yes gene_type:complete